MGNELILVCYRKFGDINMELYKSDNVRDVFLSAQQKKKLLNMTSQAPPSAVFILGSKIGLISSQSDKISPQRGVFGLQDSTTSGECLRLSDGHINPRRMSSWTGLWIVSLTKSAYGYSDMVCNIRT